MLVDYKVVDVFTGTPLKGNPVAVVLGGEFSTEEMQQIARWTNLSETTFVSKPTKPGADYRVRIFTPVEELPFAGHPTLGTAFAAIEAGIVPKKPKVVQECARGLVEIDVGEKLRFMVDNVESVPLNVDLGKSLPNLPIVGVPENVICGPHWLVVETSAPAGKLLDMQPNMLEVEELSKQHGITGICVYTVVNGTDIEMRTFASGIGEDPVCGSGNLAVAYHRKLNRPYQSSQGTAMHRQGKISIEYDGAKIFVGGQCVTVVNGTLNV